jgi:DnaJ-class molecular chaperone
MTRKKNNESSPEENSQPSYNGQPLDINTILESAKNIMGDKDSKMKIDEMLEHLSDNILGSIKGIDPASKNQIKSVSKMMFGSLKEEMAQPEPIAPENSKIDLEGRNVPRTENDKIPEEKHIFDELDSDSETEEFRKIAEDLYFKLEVSLEELYTGKTKKLQVTRKRLDPKGKLITEKRKFAVPIIKGMKHGQEIRFNKEGNEKYGYRSGDIIIELAANTHHSFERIGNVLCHVKNISLYESYAAAKGLINVIIQHLDGTYMILNINDGVPLHAKDGMRKIRHGGMPFFNKKTNKFEYDDLIIRFNLILPTEFDSDESMQIIERMFPVIDKESIIHKDPKKHGFQIENSKTRHVLLEETNLEDERKIDYVEEMEESGSESDSESGSGSGSE